MVFIQLVFPLVIFCFLFLLDPVKSQTPSETKLTIEVKPPEGEGSAPPKKIKLRPLQTAILQADCAYHLG
jgi:hypothetical protein